MLFALAKSYLTSYLFLFTYYFQKNPAVLGKSEEVKGKKKKSRTCVQDFLARVDRKDANYFDRNTLILSAKFFLLYVKIKSEFSIKFFSSS